MRDDAAHRHFFAARCADQHQPDLHVCHACAAERIELAQAWDCQRVDRDMRAAMAEIRPPPPRPEPSGR